MERTSKPLATPHHGCGTTFTRPVSRVPYRESRSAFTLIEVLAVMIVLGILASVAALSVRGHLQRARLIRAADRLAFLDRRAREEARRLSQFGQLQFSAQDRKAEVLFPGSAGTQNAIRRVTLSDVELRDVRIGQGGSGQERVVLVSPAGQSESYALHLSAPNGASLWLVTLGLSGQHLRFESEEDARAMLAP